ncbi:methyl-accepting chemotaxis protein [Notoacmeibacter sp. MSK16QG-6]|uniref:methyl-accepting chemotaxis protein n=1 Tax=Notoacmeibacter sp. MSK16QG-6 TaxID=2957982 RepID=UPI00209F1316|nr:methyl-accepting chemotaxis protein [Notoacmeibacter sp. MSK16QG-6]MCP1200900.1 methyl-accepting chemotaxis protein [Notoacmeibacter sp. MSK16QG-6]
MTVSTVAAMPAEDDVCAASVVRPFTTLIFAGLAAQSIAIGLFALSFSGIEMPGQTLLPFAFLTFLGVALASMIALAHRLPRELVRPLAGLGEIARTGRPSGKLDTILERDDVIGAIARKLVQPEPIPEPVVEVEPAPIEEPPVAGLDEESRVALAELDEALKELARGNFQHSLDISFPGEIGMLKDSFETAQIFIRDTLSKVSQSVEGLGAGVGEIVSASDDLSKRTERQAVALEETVSTLGTVVDEVRTSATRLEETSNVATSARQDAEASSQVVDEALSAMEQIETSATKINQIITVIDEIAFQTNLLALNAGVEAARAGDAGQGFAVVASEVRALAQRSANAAREISSLITQSTKQIADGSRLVNQTGSALKRISDHVLNISQNVGTITESAQEQTHALDTLNKSAVEMDGMTQQNAAMAEEVTAASHSLQSHTSEISALLQDLQTGSVSQRRSARPQAALPPQRPARGSVAATDGHELKSAAAALKSANTARFADLARQGREEPKQRNRHADSERAASQASRSVPLQEPAASKSFAPNLTLGNAAIDEDWEEF